MNFNPLFFDNIFAGEAAVKWSSLKNDSSQPYLFSNIIKICEEGFDLKENTLEETTAVKLIQPFEITNLLENLKSDDNVQIIIEKESEINSNQLVANQNNEVITDIKEVIGETSLTTDELNDFIEEIINIYLGNNQTNNETESIQALNVDKDSILKSILDNENITITFLSGDEKVVLNFSLSDSEKNLLNIPAKKPELLTDQAYFRIYPEVDSSPLELIKDSVINNNSLEPQVKIEISYVGDSEKLAANSSIGSIIAKLSVNEQTYVNNVQETPEKISYTTLPYGKQQEIKVTQDKIQSNQPINPYKTEINSGEDFVVKHTVSNQSNIHNTVVIKDTLESDNILNIERTPNMTQSVEKGFKEIDNKELPIVERKIEIKTEANNVKQKEIIDNPNKVTEELKTSNLSTKENIIVSENKKNIIPTTTVDKDLNSPKDSGLVNDPMNAKDKISIDITNSNTNSIKSVNVPNTEKTTNINKPETLSNDNILSQKDKSINSINLETNNQKIEISKNPANNNYVDHINKTNHSKDSFAEKNIENVVKNLLNSLKQVETDETKIEIIEPVKIQDTVIKQAAVSTNNPDQSKNNQNGNTNTNEKKNTQNNTGEIKAKEFAEEISKPFEQKDTIKHNFTETSSSQELKNSNINAVKPNINLGMKDLQNTFKTIKTTEIISELSKGFQNNEVKTITFQLTPENLGKIKLMIDYSPNKMSANIEVENEQIKQFIQSNIEQLKNNLQNSGIQLSNLNVNLGSNDQRSLRNSQMKKKGYQNAGSIKVDKDNTESKRKMMGYNTYEYLA